MNGPSGWASAEDQGAVRPGGPGEGHDGGEAHATGAGGEPLRETLWLGHDRERPSEEDWARFRREIRAALSMVEQGETEVWFPVLGNARYHVRDVPERTRIVQFAVTDTHVEATLEDGREVRVPLAWFPILQDATEEERRTYQLETREDETDPGATMVTFPLLNTEIVVDQLLVCRNGFEESAHIAACATSQGLLGDIESLVWRLLSERAGLTAQHEIRRPVLRKIMAEIGRQIGAHARFVAE